MENDTPYIQNDRKEQDKIIELEQKINDLLTENAEYKRLYEKSPINYQSLDDKGNFLNVNQAWLDNLGYAREEIIGHNFSEFLDQNSRDHYIQNFPKLKSQGEVMGVEFQLIKKNGKKILVSLNGHIGKDSENNFHQTYCVFQDITQQRLLEEALEKSEERFRLAMEASNDGLWDWNLETGEVYYSPAYSIMLGYLDKEVPPNADFWKERIHPDDQENTFKANQDCIENRCDSFKVEFRMQAKDGTWRWILGRGMATSRDTDGKALRLIGTHAEITTQKEQERRLRLGKRKMQSIFRAAPIGIGVVSQRVFTEVNDFFCKMVGYSRAELLHQNSRMLYCSDEEYEGAGSEKYKQIRKLGIGSVETRMKCKDGTIIDVFLSSAPLNPDDLSDGVTFTALDITEAKQIQLRLRESEKKYRTMMESMIDPVYICSSDLKIIYMNPAMIKRVGRDATGEECFKALHDLDDRCSWCHFSSVAPGSYYEIDILSPKDNRYYHVSSSPMTQPNGSIVKLTVLRDTTELKRTQDQLQQAQKMESIGKLAGGIAHDFNNILSAIIGYSEMAESELPTESEAGHYVQMVLEGADRATELVKQILAFSRKNSLKKTPVRILSVVEEAMKMMRSSLPSSIDIRFSFDLSDEMVLADPTGIHQIIVNLCTNSFHAMIDQKGIIQVSLRLEDVTSGKVSTEWQVSSGTFIVLTVQDNGYGIERKIIKRIFEPYFTTKEIGKGTGLGLAVVHGIVKTYQGFIEVESNRGKGSTFSVYLPLAKQDLPKVSMESSAESLPTGNEHILFIDDERSLCEIGKQSLERLGYHVTALNWSKKAFELFKVDPGFFDLIISDQTMPEITGSGLALKVFKLRPAMPFIICTGYASTITEEEALAIGIHHLIEKPVSTSLLAHTVRSALDEKNTQ